MSAFFYDLQSEHNPHNGRALIDERSTLALLGELQHAAAAIMCQFEANDGSHLTVGIAPAYGCAQYTKAEDMPPYLMAVVESESGSPMEFLVADTPTPIDGRYRVNWATLEQVVVYFVNTSKRSPNVRWEEFKPT